MSMTDPIADFLTRIRNALAAGHTSVQADGSTMKARLAAILEAEGYIDGWKKEEDGPKSTIEIRLKYDVEGTPVIRGLRRVSTPGRRVYCSAQEVPKVLDGLGVSIVSTSQGVISGQDARSRNIGGEVLCEVW
ncbi:MAG: 30S ribosomal protein S8 [Acidobacteriota bacterium]